ncbi:hypothetical protein P168DRAFT_280390 [Aspergillus campestris IBT 28561]|uniref:Uncharacterized protein n=1 Tax=Aspergillus campestris (strain IBT 28561) TaxID=1392248 RepID=A0A2I1D6G3_ASPC2|nr:uncharacterized protein P168DRAFT_280390 [Aspergillus campestris IBT 28561]PKY05458.1 hypothetical protein P168DRAFT_280390 [Aspergillus campestris IBT 28561]
MARVTRQATRNTLKPKKPGKRQSRRKPIPKVAVQEETAGESETEESHEESDARVPEKKDHLKKYKERIQPDPKQRRFETPMLHFNPDTQVFKKREETATENMAAVDARDVTSGHRDQDDWSLENLPDILYVLRPKPENAKSRRKVHMTDHMIFEKKVKNFYTLPPRISSQVEGFRLEAWFRLDRRIKPEDILDRVNPMFRHLISEEIIEGRRESFRLAYNVADWTSQRSINAVTRQVKREGFDVEQNTTRGVTPGLIDPAKGEAGGRVVFDPAAYQHQPSAMDQEPQIPEAWFKMYRFHTSSPHTREGAADPHQTSIPQQHGVKRDMETVDAQLMRLAHSHMAAPVPNQDNRVNQLNQINYFAAPGSAVPVMGGSYVASGQQKYYPQVAHANNPMMANNPMLANNPIQANYPMQTNNPVQVSHTMQSSQPMQVAPAQGNPTQAPKMAGQAPAPKSAIPAANAKKRRTRVKPNGSPFLSTAALPAPAHIGPASACMARSGTPYQAHVAQVNQYPAPAPMNGYQQGMFSAHTTHAANSAATTRAETASRNVRAPQFSSELYPFFEILNGIGVSDQGDAFGGANAHSNAHTGHKRTWETGNNGVPVLMDKKRRSDPFGMRYPTEVTELAEHSGPMPEEFTQTGDEDLSQEVNFDEWLVESAMSADGHIEWRSGIWPGIGVDPDKTEEEKEKEKKEKKEKEDREKEEKEKKEMEKGEGNKMEGDKEEEEKQDN